MIIEEGIARLNDRLKTLFTTGIIWAKPKWR